MNKIGGRILQLIPAILIQVAVIILLITVLKPIATFIWIACEIVGLIFVVSITSHLDEALYKEAWIILILLVPIFGVVLYLLFGNRKTGKDLRKAISASHKELNYKMPNASGLKELEESNLRFAKGMKYISDYTGMEIYRNEGTRYYPVGEKAFPDMLEDMKNAKKYIFMEYFIFDEGEFEGALTEVMAQKAAEGLDVRIMYDDLGSIGTFAKNNVKWLKDHGIKVVVFNPIKYLTLKINNRDHRKMTVIDGEIAYSGGINIADEYINTKVKYGHWKDTSFRVTGDAVINYVYMFTEFWNAFSDSDKLPKEILPDKCKDDGKDGIILSYYESPVRSMRVSNTLYMELLGRSSKYFWIFTPYLMLGDSLQEAMRRAAGAGVDVRIIVPGIPDKKIAYAMTRSNYRPLMEAGVKIYEYTPGFVHAKSLVCDDLVATIGTVNWDFRSLFLHFENNSLFCGSEVIKDVKTDFLDTLTKCTERKLDDGGPGVKHRWLDSLLRLFSPLC